MVNKKGDAKMVVGLLTVLCIILIIVAFVHMTWDFWVRLADSALPK